MWHSRRGFTGDEEAHDVTVQSKKAARMPIVSVERGLYFV